MNIKRTILVLLTVLLFAGATTAGSNPSLPDPPTDLIVMFADDGSDPNIIFEFCVPNYYPETVKYSIISDLTVKYTDPNVILGRVDDGFMARLNDPNIILTIGDPNSCVEGTKVVTVTIKESLLLRELLIKAPWCVEICTVTDLVVMGSACGQLSGFKIKPLNPPGGQAEPTESQNNEKSDPFWIEDDLGYDSGNSVLEDVRNDLGCAPIVIAPTTGRGNNGNGKGKGKPDK